MQATALALAATAAEVAVGPWASRKAGAVAAYALAITLRGGVMVGGGAILVAGRFINNSRAFWLWLLAAYLAALVSETVMSARARGHKKG